jgi:hypothetical protein
MNSKTLALAAVLVTACFAAHTAFAGENDIWLAYAARNGLPLTHTSNPPVSDEWVLSQMSASDGADRVAIMREARDRNEKRLASRAGDGGGNGHTALNSSDPCTDLLMQQMSRADGNPEGKSLRCAP